MLRQQVFFQMLSFRRAEGAVVPFSLRLYLDMLTKAGGDAPVQLACKLQMQVLSLWWDKLLRLKSSAKMREMMTSPLGLRSVRLDSVLSTCKSVLNQ